MAELPVGLSPEMPVLPTAPADSIPMQEAEDPGFDEKDLAACILDDFKNDIADKQQMDWAEKRAYDIRSYYGIKDLALSNWPWRNASNFPVPITPTLVDTGVANVKASQYSKSDQITKVKGIGVEDVRKAPLLEAILNQQLLNELDISSILDAHIFRSFLHGTGTLKVTQEFYPNTVKIHSLDIENVFVPIDAKGFQVGETDHVIQVVPLSYNDLQIRKNMGIYKYPDEIMPGTNITMDLTSEQLMLLKDQATGTAMLEKWRRDNFFILECYKTYYPKSSSGYGSTGPTRAGAKPQELIVWLSPFGGRIQRVMRNEEGIRPFADAHVYPNPGRFFSMSLPEKIRHIQEKANYADKQNTDALDRAISPAGFLDDTSGFNPNVAQRVPGGIYQKGKGTGPIEWEPVPPVDRGFERQLADMWLMAERLTGLSDVTQGISNRSGRTLGETEIVTSRADIRFQTIFDRFEAGWKKTMNLVYYFDDKYMPRDKKVKILGYADYKTIDELFPKGMGGKFDFAFAGAPITEIEREKEAIKEFCREKLVDPNVVNNPATWWKITEMQAEAYGIRNIETKITKPAEVNILSPEEAIERILSGQHDIQPRPGIDTEGYIFEIQLFMRTEAFQQADPEVQFSLKRLLSRVTKMAEMEVAAMADAQALKMQMQEQAQMAQMLEAEGQGKEPPVQ